MALLKNAIKGETVYIPVENIGMDYDTQNGFPSETDLQSWCTTLNLQYQLTTLNNEPCYKITPLQ